MLIASAVELRASDIDTGGTIDQAGARVFSLSCSGILHYYVLRGCSRRFERAVRTEGRHVQQTAVEVLAFSIPLCSNYSTLIKPSNTTKYVSLLSLLLSRTTCFGPLSDHHQVFKS